MKEKKLVFNFLVNRNWKKLADSHKRAKILADNRKGHHPIETLFYVYVISDILRSPVRPWRSLITEDLKLSSV